MRLLVTAGPTREPIDPVRFISNPSTGKMGYAIARAGATRGHEVLLVSGPVSVAQPAGIRILKITTAAQMHEAVLANITWCDALVMAAAVADWRPQTTSNHKLKKSSMPAVLPIEKTPDILESVRDLKAHRLYIGFAAETENLVSEARRKLEQKGLDLIVANDVGKDDSGFESDTNRVTFLAPDGSIEELPLMSKADVAERIVDWMDRKGCDMNRE